MMNTATLLLPTPLSLQRWARICRILALAVTLAAAWVFFGSLIRFLLGWGSPASGVHPWGLAEHPLYLTGIFGQMLPAALIAWAVAQYLDYLSGAEPRGGWLARNMHRLLLLAAAGHLLLALNDGIIQPAAIALQNRRLPAEFHQPALFFAVAGLLAPLAGAVFYYGMADLIRRSRPTVEEAHTLV